MAAILRFPELADATIALHDIDAERLKTTYNVGQQIADTLGDHPVIETQHNWRAELEGADHVIGMFQVWRNYPRTVTPFEEPKKYRLCQTIGDTFNLRTDPKWVVFLVWNA